VFCRRYTDSIVAEGGFAHFRILQTSDDLKFDHTLRIKVNVILKKGQGKTENVQNDAGQNESFWADVVSWKRVVKLIIKATNNST
jgi:hypothetical protein